jgi:hypothetical protein
MDCNGCVEGGSGGELGCWLGDGGRTEIYLPLEVTGQAREGETRGRA